MFIPTAFSHIVKYIWTIPLSNMFKHFHALSKIFEEQQGICTRWGSIKSKSCLFQSAIPSHSCLSICPARWGRSWWCELCTCLTANPRTYLQCNVMLIWGGWKAILLGRSAECWWYGKWSKGAADDVKGGGTLNLVNCCFEDRLTKEV